MHFLLRLHLLALCRQVWYHSAGIKGHKTYRGSANFVYRHAQHRSTFSVAGGDAASSSAMGQARFKDRCFLTMFAALARRAATHRSSQVTTLARRHGSSGGGAFDPHPPAPDSWHMKCGASKITSNPPPSCMSISPRSRRSDRGFNRDVALGILPLQAGWVHPPGEQSELLALLRRARCPEHAAFARATTHVRSLLVRCFLLTCHPSLAVRSGFLWRSLKEPSERGFEGQHLSARWARRATS